jgi:RIO kinase 1
LHQTCMQRDALDLGDMVALPSTVATSVRESARRETAGRVRVTEKADRATVEQALDPRTRLVRRARGPAPCRRTRPEACARFVATALQVLFKMLNQGVFNAINGCISTGKEANVYHATTAAGSHLAVKVTRRRCVLRCAVHVVPC